MAASAAALSSALRDTSALMPSTSALVSFNPSTARASAPSSMSQSMTFTPAWARAVTIPSPIPDAAPVTKAVFPARSFIQNFLHQSILPNAFQDYLCHLRMTTDNASGFDADRNSSAAKSSDHGLLA